MAKPRLLSFQLDLRSGQPAFVQIVRHVERQSAAGKLQPGDQLPTVRALARQLGLNFNTVARAYRRLSAAGAVTTQRGRGTYVLEGSTPRLVAQDRRQTLEALASHFIAEARRHRFTDAQMLRAARRGLKARRSRP